MTAKENKIPYELICRAANGNTAAINSIVNLYEPYINRLAITKCVDEFGKTRYIIDDEAVGRMKTKLITKILSFNVNPKPTKKALENGLKESIGKKKE